ncbi:MAG: MBL fold metallo-hydrolase [Clostridia bacterium]|nr:MBL fold metallo-hydrolase [Clostridia bacterium]
MKIQNLFPGGYAANCYLVTEGNTAVLIDCTAPTGVIAEALEKTGTRLEAILLTHGHFDHILTLDAVKAATNAPVYLGGGDSDLPSDGQKNAFSVFFGYEKAYPEADKLTNDGDLLTLGDLSFRVMHTPGHTKGSALYLSGDTAFTGDTIFSAGFGRYDLYGGDPLALEHSLQRIATLPHNIVIYPGHGEPARLGTALDAIKGFI